MISLLNIGDVSNKEKPAETEKPAFFTDLNLEQILEKVTADWEDAGKLYEEFPADRRNTEYRRAIYRDIKKPEVYSAMTEYYGNIKERELFSERKEKAYETLQTQAWYLREVCSYIDSLEKLKDRLEKADIVSEGMKGLLDFVSECLSSEDYLKMKEEATSLRNELATFRVHITYEKEKITITDGSGRGNFEEFLSGCFPGHDKEFKNPFLDREEFAGLEVEIVNLYRKKHRDFFKRLDRFCKNHPSYIHEGLEVPEREMVYYLAYARFQKKMEERGFSFCTPEASEDKLMATGLYDLALALVNMEAGKEVISNETYLGSDERFFVLTGPNQGGKTTYGRSLGQLVWFSKMGLDVPAETAQVPYYSNLWTHFSVEESTESGRGKLMDELVRLKPIMEKEQEGAFVVINELFTTAANYDATIMGKRVLEHLIKINCRGIYVTHLIELASSYTEVVSIRANVDEELKQTYKIERSEAREITGTDRQAYKYGLTYEQLKERFS
ncbi:MAG: hypothetical protein K5686_12870 [Lachnospiraceae bacterium]|nr:hypothetical protein [Lachnospiraceae bacterium]